ncbi:MAG: type III-B CRISPR module RAMP protein Cmr4 [Deltaproteobacteria bacterium]|nr:type III-B CRISPR module RAMP protein Cmr4 [Deltaproteobacteria bacterium]
MALEIGVYLLTSTHVGAGGSAGAIDLPIAREAHTGHPLLPASALKGVARRLLDPKSDAGKDTPAARLFGPPPPQKGEAGEPLVPGEAVFTDGVLLAFPVRSLTHAFVWVTCRHSIERWRRGRRLLGLGMPAGPKGTGAISTLEHKGPLVLDSYATVLEGGANADLAAVAAAWASLLPKDDGVAAQLPKRLVCLPDADFSHLVQRCTPVTARVQLTPGKTTDTYRGEGADGKEREYKGNLWYEESLPPECLFVFSVQARTQGDLSALSDAVKNKRKVLQIGGNETVGMGLTAWTIAKA